MTKELGLVQFVAGSKYNWREEKIEKELIIKADGVLDECALRQFDD